MKSLCRSKFDIISLNTGLFFRWVSQPVRSAQETGNGFQSYSWNISTELLKVECPGILFRAIWQLGLTGEDSQAPALKVLAKVLFCAFLKVPLLRQMQDIYTHLDKSLLGLSLTGGGLGLVINGSFILVGRLVLRSLVSCLSSVNQFLKHQWNTIIRSRVVMMELVKSADTFNFCRTSILHRRGLCFHWKRNQFQKDMNTFKTQSNYRIGVVTVVKMLIANVNINVNCDFLRKK